MLLSLKITHSDYCETDVEMIDETNIEMVDAVSGIVDIQLQYSEEAGCDDLSGNHPSLFGKTFCSNSAIFWTFD